MKLLKIAVLGLFCLGSAFANIDAKMDKKVIQAKLSKSSAYKVSAKSKKSCKDKLTETLNVLNKNFEVLEVSGCELHNKYTGKLPQNKKFQATVRYL